MRNRRKKRSSSKVVGILVLLGLIAGAGYIYTAPEFEREAPVVKSEKSIFWNRKDPLQIHISDNRSLKNYELVINDGTKSVMVEQENFDVQTEKQTLLLKYPKGDILNTKATQLELQISVTDASKWNFFQGNKTLKTVQIIVDDIQPNVNVVANSYSITQGGAALVVFQANDENMDELYIKAAGKKFQAQPYKKEGYYAALIAWPFDEANFSAKVVAVDKAKNKRVSDVPFYVKNKKYRVSWIKVKDKFLDGKITDLALNCTTHENLDDKLDKLRAVNETMRLKNEEEIYNFSKNISKELLDSWSINKFYPLRNGAKVASFGDKRHYYYGTKDNEVSQSYHVGYDLASTKMAAIKTSNAGTVVYANENGIYGNMPMIDHGLGLYSLYGHCSALLVKEGDEVKVGQVIAKTGVSGLALGDHLHFGVLVQGVAVRPVEWFDGGWIKTNIDNVFKVADKIISAK